MASSSSTSMASSSTSSTSMASSSSSTSSAEKSFKYDVFLSFRGEDTRKTFVDHFYHALQQKSIHTYKDDERIKKGERIGDELIKSIEDSKFYIIVFSKTYASSSWCLEELVKIMECQKTTEHTAYPVFYDVEPTEVRKQIGEFGKAFAKHENDEAAEKWREALKEAADLAGWELKNTLDGHEAKFIKKIVEEISLELRSINISMDEKLVGMKTRIKDVISSLEMDFEDVRMIGIKGMGGGGKTTLARAVFDQISIQFESKSFVENVREISNRSFSGLKSLQEKILSNVLNDKDITIDSVYDGKHMMKKVMCGRKVLVVLDDVDHIHQLEALAGGPSWFKPGSRVIITTRDEQVLVAHRVNLIRDVNLLSNREALRLFSRYAFGRKIPIQGYEELSSQVVLYAAGLPLTITVLGSFLCGKNELEWKDVLQRLKTIPLKDTLDKLELSYIGLEEDYKEIFLDVACMLKGWWKEKAITALESCGFHARNGLRVLEQRSLITISEFGELDMHDRIEEMGQYIVRRKLEEPNKHSRLWIDEEIKDILVSDQGTNEAIRCIKLNTSSELNPEIVMNGLGNMKKLRFLHVGHEDEDCINSNWKFDEGRQYFPNTLRCLRWIGYPFGSFPKSFQANNLVHLEMFGSKIVQLWEGGDRKVLNKLRFLDITHSKLKNLDLGLTPNLETLRLDACRDLVELHMPIECPTLISFDLMFSKLTTIDLRGTPNLERLRVNHCVDLVQLHMPFECPKLIFFDHGHSKLTTLDLQGTSNLERLSLGNCVDLVELHMPVECPKLISLDLHHTKLTTLDLRGTLNLERLSVVECVDLVELHMPVECLKLKTIDINRSKLRTLDLRGTPNLESLRVVECVDLVQFHMPVECPELISLKLSNSKLTALDLRGTPNLESLRVVECVDLVQFHMPVECLELISLKLSHSKLTALDLRGTPNLERLSVVECVDLVELHIPVECLKLKTIDINRSKLRTLDLRGTPNLESLRVVECVDLVELHIPVECLKLETIDINRSKLRTLHLRGTPNIESLRVVECVDLVELHIPVECLKLKTIDINRSKLRTLDLRETPNLKSLRVTRCVDLVQFHMPVECPELISLKLSHSKLTTLDLRGTPNLERLSVVECVDLELHIPVECLKLKIIEINRSKLRTLDLRGTPNLESLRVVECVDLELHIPVECLKLETIDINRSKLRTLDLRGTPNLESLRVVECVDLVELHIPVECLKLKTIDINRSKLRTLDLRGTPNLESLRVVECYELVELHIHVECLKLKSIEIMGAKLRTFDLGLTSNLEMLSLTKCYYLAELHASVGSLKMLAHLDLSGCLKFKSFLAKKMSESLEVGSFSELHLIVESLDMCPLHSDSNLAKFRFTCSYEEQMVPSSIGNLEKLIPIGLCACIDLERFSQNICGLRCLTKLTLEGGIPEAPKDLGQLECLMELSLSTTKITHLPESICMLKLLKILKLQSCWRLEKLPEDLGGLECLEDLTLSECIVLRDIPNSICKMKRLKYFELLYCYLVEKLPEEFGCLKSLKLLNIEGTGISHLPQSIFELKGLRIAGFRWLLELLGFASVIHTSGDVTFCHI